MKTRGMALVLALALSACASSGVSASASTAYVVERLNFLPLTDYSRTEWWLLDAILRRRISSIDLLLSRSGGGVDINTVLCFHEVSQNPFIAQFESGTTPYTISSASILPGDNAWVAYDQLANGQVSFFWRTYPRAISAACPYGYARIYGTALMIAARNRDAQMVQELLRRGASPNIFVRLGNDEWMYAAKEAYRGANDAQAKEAARAIALLLKDANAGQVPGDRLVCEIPTAPGNEFAAAIAKCENERMRMAQKRQERRAKDLAFFGNIFQRDAAIKAEKERKQAVAEEYRQKAHKIQLQAIEDEGYRRRSIDYGGTSKQLKAADSLGLDRVAPYGYGQGYYGGKLFKDSSGRLYRVDPDGNVRQLSK